MSTQLHFFFQGNLPNTAVITHVCVRAEQLLPRNCNTQPNYPINITSIRKLPTAEHIHNSMPKATSLLTMTQRRAASKTLADNTHNTA